MTMLAKVFQNGRSQAVRLPKECRFDTDEVYIEKVGNSLIITPKKEDKWDNFFDNLRNMDTSNFMDDVEQLPMQERDLF
ncbi:MAG: type II toxin-antitoxin system VapB family antitoxin [Campylobacterota bacterium]|nr:type II toxin-antitoxin system VapB family antitoxin [Campylobacterota bacterium]